jgi:hypothetical protein
MVSSECPEPGTRERGVREGHAHGLALTSVDDSIPERTACGAVRRPAGKAVRARAVAERERRDDEVAHGDAVDLLPDLLNHADELMAD